MSRSFLSAWLGGEASARAFLDPVFADPKARIAAARSARERAQYAVPDEVGAALLAQDDLHPPNPVRKRNAEAIARREAAVAVTGQQVGLFLGPLYTFYKAASAIAVARTLEAEAGVRCVPLFWLQTEDHDFAEIDHCFLPGVERLSLAPDAARISVAHRRLGDDVLACLDGLDRAISGTPHGPEVSALFREAYAPGRSLAGAFARVLAEIFRDEGLVLFDPRDPRIARASVPIYQRAIVEQDAIANELEERSRTLEAAGYDPQVKVRGDVALVFRHEEAASGPRYRFDARALPETEVLAELERDPLRFSTSALLRPIVQDTLFPTVAYVGGPAEVAYFAQLRPLYQRFGSTMPMIVPRARFRVVDDKSRALLEKIHLSPADVERPLAELRALASRAIEGDLPSADTLKESLFPNLDRALAELSNAAMRADPTLAKPAEKTAAAIGDALFKFFEKYDRARLERDRVASERIDRLRAFLCPEGHPQERHFSVAWFLARFGLREFKERIFGELEPFAGKIGDVAL